MECEKCNYWNSSLGICTDSEEFIDNDGESVCRYHHEATLRPAYQSEWISVEDRLPEPRAMVLAFMPNCFIGMVYYSGASFREPWGDEFPASKQPVHWMPLPDPPKTLR
jgi:hypothetical protein